MKQLARAMQDLLTTTADSLARTTGFVQRQRKVTGSNFAQTLVFSYLSDSMASSSRIQVTAAAVGLKIARQSFEERLTPRGAEFLKQLLAEATTKLIATPVAIPLFDRFTAVEVLDSSIVALPNELADTYRGGRSGTTRSAKASLKISVGLDLKAGILLGPELTEGRSADLSAEIAQRVPSRGSLHLADLSYFGLPKFARWGAAGVYWLSRLKIGTVVSDTQGRRLNLLKILRDAKGQDLDREVLLGAGERLPCRLIARQVPAHVARKRRERLREKARRRHEPVSELALALAGWTILVTNVARALLSVEEAMALARMRWQIELLFKLWKSRGRIDEWISSRCHKTLCIVYAKLLAMIIEHWTIVTGCWDQADRSPTKAARVVESLALSFALAIRSLTRLSSLLKHASEMMKAACRMEHCQSAPNAHDRVLCFGPSP